MLRTSWCSSFSLAALALLAGAMRGVAQDRGAAEAVDYLRDIKPLLAARCVSCHGRLKQESSLRVDVVSTILSGGDRGPAIVPFDSEASVLMSAVRGSDGWRMPPEGDPLAEEDIARLAAWIDTGAVAPDEPLPNDPREHWAFKAPRRPAIEPVDGSASAIDALLAKTHAERGLSPVAEAPPHVLLRRVHIDLVGVPPSPKELRDFLNDPAKDAYERVVDRLLADPRHGERWGRHWMDVWRYSDWAGFKAEVRDSQPHIWRWRDWIVESLNADKPYDRMIAEMLAGDEIAPIDQDTLRATGFLARNFYLHNRNVWMERAVEHTAKAFLGVTLNCARCHDHMYDPIAQEDFYRFRAFFEPYTVRNDMLLGRLADSHDTLVRVVDQAMPAVTRLFIRGDERTPDESTNFAPGVPDVLGELGAIEPVALPASAYYPALDERVGRQLLAEARGAAEKAKVALADALASTADEADKRRATLERDEAMWRALLVEAALAADDARFLGSDPAEGTKLAKQAAIVQYAYDQAKARADVARGEALLAERSSATPPVARLVDLARSQLELARKKSADLAIAGPNPDGSYDELTPRYPETSSGRRTALARWMTDRQNPLTARVGVNHIWLRHFGAGLVPTVFDFGNNGAAPWQPELLDWLAVEFMESGWSMKHVHRLIVTSAAYRRESLAASSENLAIDPDNVYLWRMNARRMEAEVVRDGVLSVAGALDLTMGGPDLDPQLALTSTRRSLYFRTAREKQVEFMTLFDAANPSECYRRNESIVPQQALALANSELSTQQSRRLARAVSAELESRGEGGQAAFITAAFEQVLSRPASAEESRRCLEFLSRQAAMFGEQETASGDRPATQALMATNSPAASADLRARENLVHVLLNHHDFVTVR